MTDTKTDINTERQLTPEQHRVLRERGTERESQHITPT